jgi:hypothetical protein
MQATSFESAPTPSTPFPALRLKTPPPGAPATDVEDQLESMLRSARMTKEILRDVSDLADACLAELAARQAL